MPSRFHRAWQAASVWIHSVENDRGAQRFHYCWYVTLAVSFPSPARFLAISASPSLWIRMSFRGCRNLLQHGFDRPSGRLRREHTWSEFVEWSLNQPDRRSAKTTVYHRHLRDETVDLNDRAPEISQALLGLILDNLDRANERIRSR